MEPEYRLPRWRLILRTEYAAVRAQLAPPCRRSSGPQGLRYQADFISAGEEGDLIARIRAPPLAPFQFGVFAGKRRLVSDSPDNPFGVGASAVAILACWLRA